MTAAVPRGARASSCAVDLVLLAPRDGGLCVRVERAPRAGATLPWAAPRPGESLLAVARTLAKRASGADPGWMEQVQAVSDHAKHPGNAALSVAYVAVVSAPTDGARDSKDGEWVPVGEAGLGGRQATLLTAALAALRTRIDSAPIAFKLLPATFTLSELQQMYELLLGWRLHKASFRRSLQAAFLVEPIDEWRSEGRGRPAQLYRYAPRRRRAGRRGVRFDLGTA